MRSRLVTRSARLALAAAAAAVLTVTATSTATAAGGKDIGQACGTNDLSFKLTEKSQAGGYYLITAKALPGITCYLEGLYPSASFGSSVDSEVSPAEHSVSETLKLSGNTVAYAGIDPRTTNNDNAKQYDFLHLSLAGDETNSITLSLPKTTKVDQPIATNWHAKASDAIPFSN